MGTEQGQTPEFPIGEFDLYWSQSERKHVHCQMEGYDPVTQLYRIDIERDVQAKMLKKDEAGHAAEMQPPQKA